eukprot:TRINITY_DN109910_c0_g1_i1.p1 TRINITY_DN109910_c0_g1~~TRINITY_DN109910_c0_g1_i1.p1  ORF type:complete len:227 (+),score=42.38 TRINITY_DN109910_c0_g1_i1:86-766(+)
MSFLTGGRHYSQGHGGAAGSTTATSAGWDPTNDFPQPAGLQQNMGYNVTKSADVLAAGAFGGAAGMGMMGRVHPYGAGYVGEGLKERIHWEHEHHEWEQRRECRREMDRMMYGRERCFNYDICSGQQDQAMMPMLMMQKKMGIKPPPAPPGGMMGGMGMMGMQHHHLHPMNSRYPPQYKQHGHGHGRQDRGCCQDPYQTAMETYYQGCLPSQQQDNVIRRHKGVCG